MSMKKDVLWEMSYRYKQAAKAEADLKEAEGDTGDYTIFDHYDAYRPLDRF